MLRRIFRRENRIQTETRPRQKRQKEAGLLSYWETERKKWSWGRHSESWARSGSFLEEVGLGGSYQ